MHIVTVGKPYLEGETSLPEGTEFNIQESIHELKLFWQNVSPIEKYHVSSDTLHFGLRVEGPAIFLLFKFEDCPGWSDAPFNVHLNNNLQRDMPEEIGADNDHAPLYITLADSRTGIVKALRISTFSPEFTKTLKEAIVAQAETDWIGNEAYDKFLTNFYQKYPTPQSMLDRLDARCIGGE